MRHTAIPAALLLAACVQTSPDTVDTVKVGSETYPITIDQAGNWRVHIDGRSVICSKPEKDACYWTARHVVTSQELLDDLG